MSNTKSNQASRKAGGWRIYGNSDQAGFDDIGQFLRRLRKVENYSTEQIVMKIAYFLSECQKNPSLAKQYGLKEREIVGLTAVWGDLTKPKSKEEMDRLKKAVDSFLIL